MTALERSETILALTLGPSGYAATWELQRRIQRTLIEAKRGTPPRRPDHLMLLVEHPPVFTLGKSGDESNLLLDEASLRREGFEFHRIDRGGDITYHGPGQLVVYPILDLDRFFTDIHRYLRQLEEAVIRTCSDFGVVAGRVAGRTGVWIGPDERGPERKVCAMGIRCSRWVTMHGLALNVSSDLSHYDHIVPCGISDRSVTSLAAEIPGAPPSLAGVASRLVFHLGEGFGAAINVFPEPLRAREAMNEWLASEAAPDRI